MNQSTIKSLRAWEILDSRGNPTVKTEVITESGIRVTASSPSGASTGKHEAIELRDMDKTRYLGKGVLQAVTNVNDRISGMLAGRSCTDQHEIDSLIIEADGSQNMSVFGANATTAVSIACAKAAAAVKGVSLYRHIFEIFAGAKRSSSFPVPAMNVINGGKHAGSGLAIQEFLILPVGGGNRDSVANSIRMGSEIYHKLASILGSRLNESSINVGDEGGFAPSLEYGELALSYICDAITQSGYEAGKNVLLGIDAAASNFWNASKQKYVMNNLLMSSEDLLTFYCELADKYPLKYIEDPFMEEDFDSFAKITEELGSKVTIVGDDIFVTNKTRIDEGVKMRTANGIIIKVNQVGTLTGAMEAARASAFASWKVIASHRSGETNDDWLADLAVGIGADAIKAGAPTRGERIAKYNRLMRIEQEEEFKSLR